MIARKLILATMCGCAMTWATSAFADAKHGTDTPEGKIAATVNDRPVSQLVADRVIEQLKAQGQQSNNKQIIEELINLELLTQEAERLELDKKQEVATALHLQYTQTMANAYLASYSNDLKIDDEEIRAEYEKQISAMKASEFKASHILLDSEEDAKNVIKLLGEGNSFEDMAKEHSTGPTGANGGDLGWFQPENMVPEFSDAVAKLEKGQTSEAPVQTQFGWHIIKLVDTRAAAKPDFSDQVKAGIRNSLLREKLAAHVQSLRSSADIVIK